MFFNKSTATAAAAFVGVVIALVDGAACAENQVNALHKRDDGVWTTVSLTTTVYGTTTQTVQLTAAEVTSTSCLTTTYETTLSPADAKTETGSPVEGTYSSAASSEGFATTETSTSVSYATETATIDTSSSETSTSEASTTTDVTVVVPASTVIASTSTDLITSHVTVTIKSGTLTSTIWATASETLSVTIPSSGFPLPSYNSTATTVARTTYTNTTTVGPATSFLSSYTYLSSSSPASDAVTTTGYGSPMASETVTAGASVMEASSILGLFGFLMALLA
ncbi:hypothetical protein SMACR_07175 [Sordaria macrospora]|uniref:WGS project CABT00000000 data, contig 2.40 n=2 Tax=Sordaria macrospora TaxID=5147 RepID=F7W7Q8_SORMK|nr:uncharacterized protein SMAC_07175 [Sordaria macrospora k-hell]KAA8631710.1 hypothetical protein SMACR_07175 [Sordaria macrospora]KAH7626070.1 hypothetical protein B0T09DRAFT_49404 [Sordaria sp. MPI-SDFR-AT-0083]WPJ61248.1 hypothetical protein SMAC4_07175 [Sordaria macrospora]CCC13550.1 unnamed protein product [Sordaria macrospora k-hell]